jgi:L-ascorbate metabolism protein UlaG (beta-lactamase superfamily)
MRRILFALAALLALAGCGGNPTPVAQTSPRLTRIDWLGNQCYRVTSSLGTSLLTNPYAAKTGGRTLPSPLKTDIVLITTERPDSNNINAIDNQPAILRGGVGIGLSTITGIPVRGVPTYRNPEIQSVDGMNLTFAWTMDGMRFCFPGRQSRVFDSEQLAQIGPVDILFLPMDSLGASARNEIIAQLRPKLVIPMGGNPTGLAVGDARGVTGTSLSFTRQMLPAQTTTFTFQR